MVLGDDWEDRVAVSSQCPDAPTTGVCGKKAPSALITSTEVPPSDDQVIRHHRYEEWKANDAAEALSTHFPPPWVRSDLLQRKPRDTRLPRSLP